MLKKILNVKKETLKTLNFSRFFKYKTIKKFQLNKKNSDYAVK